MKNRKGFTIVELVIVIAVIAILAAVLIPTFSGVVKKANESAAQQQATNALKVILAGNTNGALKADSYMYLDEDKVTGSDSKYSAEYVWKYNGNKLEAVASADLPNATALAAYSQVIIGAKADTDNTGATTTTPYPKSYALAAHLLGAASGTLSTTANDDGSYTLTYGDSNAKIKVWINTDLAEGIIVFVK